MHLDDPAGMASVRLSAWGLEPKLDVLPVGGRGGRWEGAGGGTFVPGQNFAKACPFRTDGNTGNVHFQAYTAGSDGRINTQRRTRAAAIEM